MLRPSLAPAGGAAQSIECHEARRVLAQRLGGQRGPMTALAFHPDDDLALWHGRDVGLGWADGKAECFVSVEFVRQRLQPISLDIERHFAMLCKGHDTPLAIDTAGRRGSRSI